MYDQIASSLMVYLRSGFIGKVLVFMYLQPIPNYLWYLSSQK